MSNSDICKIRDIILLKKQQINSDEIQKIFNNMDEKDRKYFECLHYVMSNSVSGKTTAMAKLFYQIMVNKINSMCTNNKGGNVSSNYTDKKLCFNFDC